MRERTPKIEAFYYVKKDLTERMLSVLKAIEKLQPCTYLEVETYLDRRSNSVTNRITELVSVGLVYVIGKIRIGKHSYTVYHTSSREQAKELQKWFFIKYRSEIDDLEQTYHKLDKDDHTAKKVIKERIKRIKFKQKLLSDYTVK